MELGLTIVYFIVGLVTLGLILLHSGRGGGLSDMFGGGLSAGASSSTTMERNLDRMTIVFSMIFVFLTIALALSVDG